MPTPSRSAVSCPPEVKRMTVAINRAYGLPLIDCAQMTATDDGGLRTETTDPNGTKTRIEINREGEIYRSRFCGEAVKDKYGVERRVVLTNDSVEYADVPKPLCEEERRVLLPMAFGLRDVERMRRALRSQQPALTQQENQRCESAPSGREGYNVFAADTLKGWWVSRNDAKNHVKILDEAGKCDGTAVKPAHDLCAILRTQDLSWVVFVNGEINEWFWEEEDATDHARSLGCNAPLKKFK